MKKIISLNNEWTFCKEGVKETVNLPHTWNSLDGQGSESTYYKGACTYTRIIPKYDGKVFLELNGANSYCKVLVNGRSAGEHKGGYSTCRFELTKLLTSPKNFLEITVDNKDEKLRPGMFARVTVNYGNNFRVVVPDNAVLKQVGADEKYVYVLNEDGTVTHTPVKVGVRMGKRYEIISGIDDGATIVTSGQTRLRNNIKVDIVK